MAGSPLGWRADTYPERAIPGSDLFRVSSRSYLAGRYNLAMGGGGCEPSRVVMRCRCWFQIRPLVSSRKPQAAAGRPISRQAKQPVDHEHSFRNGERARRQDNEGRYRNAASSGDGNRTCRLRSRSSHLSAIAAVTVTASPSAISTTSPAASWVSATATNERLFAEAIAASIPVAPAGVVAGALMRGYVQFEHAYGAAGLLWGNPFPARASPRYRMGSNFAGHHRLGRAATRTPTSPSITLGLKISRLWSTA